ncbi:unnamed protein product [Cochlearia groenlandica]
MAHIYGFNYNRWIIFHVASIALIKVNAQSHPPPSPNESQSNQGPSSRSTVFAVLVTLFFLIGLLSVYIRHCLRSNPGSPGFFRRGAEHGCSRLSGLDDAVIESFPVFAYSSIKESKMGSGDLECAICLSELEEKETVRLLPICNHLFHVDCVDAWLHSHVTCPVCRSDLTAKSDKTNTRSPIRDHVAIYIDPTEDSAVSHQRRPRSEIAGKFPRSNSTGHSMGRLSEDTEKFTLRLSDDVKMQIMAAKGRRLKRTRSFDGNMTAAGSSYTIGSGEKSDPVNWVERWGLFVSKSNSDSVKSQKSNGESLK